MALRAFSLGALENTGLSACPGPLHIDSVRHRLQVVRVAAERVLAEMIRFEAFGDRTDEERVGDPMGLAEPLLAVPLAEIEDPIAVLVRPRRPLPAGVGDPLDLGPEADDVRLG